MLLIAAPSMLDPNFRRSAILLIGHDADGALGVVLNRPTELRVCDLVEQLTPLAGTDALIHEGGPVQRDGLVVLADFATGDAESTFLLDTIRMISEADDLETLGAEVERARVFVGYAGWAPGQLEAELAREDWILAQAQAEDVFCDQPSALWASVLTRKGGAYRYAASMPDDPSLN